MHADPHRVFAARKVIGLHAGGGIARHFRHPGASPRVGCSSRRFYPHPRQTLSPACRAESRAMSYSRQQLSRKDKLRPVGASLLAIQGTAAAGSRASSLLRRASSVRARPRPLCWQSLHLGRQDKLRPVGVSLLTIQGRAAAGSRASSFLRSASAVRARPRPVLAVASFEPPGHAPSRRSQLAGDPGQGGYRVTSKLTPTERWPRLCVHLAGQAHVGDVP